MAHNVMTQLIDHGNVRRGFWEYSVQAVTSDIARSLHLDNAHGVLVNSITAGGAAEKAGLQRGDVITSVNGESGEGHEQPSKRGLGDDARHGRQGRAVA